MVAGGGLLDLFITVRLMIIFWDSKVYFPHYNSVIIIGEINLTTHKK